MGLKMKNKKQLTKKEKIKESARKLKLETKKFNCELKKAMNTAIVAAFGFLMALVWKDVITEYVNDITALSPVQGKLISAIIITLICVIGILVVARVFKVED